MLLAVRGNGPVPWRWRGRAALMRQPVTGRLPYAGLSLQCGLVQLGGRLPVHKHVGLMPQLGIPQAAALSAEHPHAGLVLELECMVLAGLMLPIALPQAGQQLQLHFSAPAAAALRQV